MKKIVWITGASRGIGKAAAVKFAENGYDVAVHCYRQVEKANILCSGLRSSGVNAVVVSADVADYAQVCAAYDKICRALGEPTVLVNNAGISQQKLFTDISVDDWDRMMSVDFTGVFNCCKAAVPSMIRNHSGRIINVSSMWGICGASCEVHYSAAKAGVIGFTKALAKELGPSGINVNCVAPGIIKTDMNSHIPEETMTALCDDTPLCRAGSAEEIAESIFFLASESASFITGHTLAADGGFSI